VLTNETIRDFVTSPARTGYREGVTSEEGFGKGTKEKRSQRWLKTLCKKSHGNGREKGVARGKSCVFCCKGSLFLGS